MPSSYSVLLTMTSRADKLWPEARWIELGRALALPVVLPWGSAEERARAERLTKALVNRLLHLPTVRLKDADPASDEGVWRLRAARELFALDRGRADHGA